MKSMEIERKWLVSERVNPTSELNGYRWVSNCGIWQGYIEGTNIIERVRESVKEHCAPVYTRTVKSGHGLERIELEDSITRAQFERLRGVCKYALRKSRHTFTNDRQTFSIDVFETPHGFESYSHCLKLAEIELEHMGQSVDIPDWLARITVREVTGDPVFENYSIAKRFTLYAQSFAGGECVY